MAIIRTKFFSKPSNKTSSDIELYDTPNKVLSFAKENAIKTTPLNVEKLVDQFGIKMEFIDLASDLSGVLFKDIETNFWIIHINKKHHINRQRYTIAHEIAHFCLHRYFKYRFEDEIFFRGGESLDKEEMEANNFAGCLLIPEPELMDFVRSGITKIDKLAVKFGVSTLALRIRAKNLGMSGHGL